LHFFAEQIGPGSLGSWCVGGTLESTPGVDSSVPLTHLYPGDLGLICLVEKCGTRFRILWDLGIQSWIFLKKRTLRHNGLQQQQQQQQQRQQQQRKQTATMTKYLNINNFE